MSKTQGFDELLKERIDEIDVREIVQQIVRGLISDDVKRLIVKVTEASIEKIIETEIEIVMKKGVSTDDGWGKKFSYGSFEELFKTEFGRRINGQYDIQRQIERWVKEKSEQMFKDKQAEVVKKVTDELLIASTKK